MGSMVMTLMTNTWRESAFENPYLWVVFNNFTDRLIIPASLQWI
jgi:hypothetical protein